MDVTAATVTDGTATDNINDTKEENTNDTQEEDISNTKKGNDTKEEYINDTQDDDTCELQALRRKNPEICHLKGCMNNRLTRMNHCSTKHEQQQNLQPTTQQCHMRGCTQLPTGKTNFCSDTHAQEHVTTPRTPKTFRSHTAQPKQCKLRGCSELKDAKSGFCSVAHKQLHATHKATANAARKEQQRASEPKSHSAMTKKCHHMGCDLPPKANTNYCSDDHKHHHAQICHLRGCVHLRTNDSHYCSPDHEQQHQVIKSARKGANAKKCRLKICQNIREPNIEYCSPAHAPERAFDMRQMGTQISMEPFQHITDQTCHLSGCVNTAVAPTNYCCVIHANMHAYAGGLHFLNHPDRPHLMHTDQTVCLLRGCGLLQAPDMEFCSLEHQHESNFGAPQQRNMGFHLLPAMNTVTPPECLLKKCHLPSLGRHNFCSAEHQHQHEHNTQHKHQKPSRNASPRQCALKGCRESTQTRSKFCSQDHAKHHRTSTTATAKKTKKDGTHTPTHTPANTKKERTLNSTSASPTPSPQQCHLRGCTNQPIARTNYCSAEHEHEHVFGVTPIDDNPLSITIQRCHLRGCVKSRIAPLNYCSAEHAAQHHKPPGGRKKGSQGKQALSKTAPHMIKQIQLQPKETATAPITIQANTRTLSQGGSVGPTHGKGQLNTYTGTHAQAPAPTWIEARQPAHEQALHQPQTPQPNTLSQQQPPTAITPAQAQSHTQPHTYTYAQPQPHAQLQTKTSTQPQTRAQKQQPFTSSEMQKVSAVQ